MSKQKLLLLVPLLGLFFFGDASVSRRIRRNQTSWSYSSASGCSPASPGTKFNVLGRPSGKPDASVIFGETLR